MTAMDAEAKPFEGKTCTCGEGRRYAQERAPGLIAGQCGSCGGTFVEADMPGLRPFLGKELTEADVRRIVREELSALTRRSRMLLSSRPQSLPPRCSS